MDTEEGVAADFDVEAHRSWRNRRIAYGVPKNADNPKPAVQNIANTENDVAQMLLLRGALVESKGEMEQDVLKRMFAKKSEWLYHGLADGNLRPMKRGTARRAADVLLPKQRTVWTPNGRFVNVQNEPPRQAFPDFAAPQPPAHMQMRLPMTRAEVTEHKLISAAQRPRPRPPDLTIQSKESWSHHQRSLQASTSVEDEVDLGPESEVASESSVERFQVKGKSGAMTAR